MAAPALAEAAVVALLLFMASLAFLLADVSAALLGPPCVSSAAFSAAMSLSRTRYAFGSSGTVGGISASANTGAARAPPPCSLDWRRAERGTEPRLASQSSLPTVSGYGAARAIAACRSSIAAVMAVLEPLGLKSVDITVVGVRG